MFGLTIKNTENKTTINIENSSLICSYRGVIATRAMHIGAVTATNSEVIFATEKEMYNFVSKLSEFCNN